MSFNVNFDFQHLIAYELEIIPTHMCHNTCRKKNEFIHNEPNEYNRLLNYFSTYLIISSLNICRDILRIHDKILLHVC